MFKSFLGFLSSFLILWTLKSQQKDEFKEMCRSSCSCWNVTVCFCLTVLGKKYFATWIGEGIQFIMEETKKSHKKLIFTFPYIHFNHFMLQMSWMLFVQYQFLWNCNFYGAVETFLKILKLCIQVKNRVWFVPSIIWSTAFSTRGTS